MKTLRYVSVVVALTVAAIVFLPSASASGWRWDRDAGAKARGDYGRNKPVARSYDTHRDSRSSKPGRLPSRIHWNRCQRIR